MENIVVYRHRTLVTNKVFYIGIGGEKRPYIKEGRNNLWNKVVNKYGYSVEIIQTNLDWDSACELEEFLISLYGRRNLNTGYLVNLTNGGEGSTGKVVSNYTKEKLRTINTGKKLSQETKNKIADSNRKRTMSEYMKKKLFESRAKKVIDENTGVIYESLSYAAKDLNLNYGTLRGYMSGLRKNKTSLKYL